MPDYKLLEERKNKIRYLPVLLINCTQFNSHNLPKPVSKRVQINPLGCPNKLKPSNFYNDKKHIHTSVYRSVYNLHID